MPLYEYECRKCKARTEVMQKLSDKPLTRCPKCKGRLEKLLSAPAIQFKGSGWYVTDYAGKKTDGAEEKKTASTETSTTDTKSASKETDSKKKGASSAKASPKAKSGD
jgi:putative FmdB family regulatory protein